MVSVFVVRLCVVAATILMYTLFPRDPALHVEDLRYDRIRFHWGTGTGTDTTRGWGWGWTVAVSIKISAVVRVKSENFVGANVFDGAYQIFTPTWANTFAPLGLAMTEAFELPRSNVVDVRARVAVPRMPLAEALGLLWHIVLRRGFINIVAIGHTDLRTMGRDIFVRVVCFDRVYIYAHPVSIERHKCRYMYSTWTETRLQEAVLALSAPHHLCIPPDSLWAHSPHDVERMMVLGTSCDAVAS